MGVRTQKNGAIVPREKDKPNRQPDPPVVALAKHMKGSIAAALPRHLNPERMMRIVLTALRTTPRLQECTKESFAGSILQASQLGLEPNTPLGHCYLVPYKKTCQLIIGYQGMMDIARRSGMVESISGACVYQGDEFEHQMGTEPRIRHVPGDDTDDPNKLTHVYAIARLKGSSEPIFTVLTRRQVDKYRKRSASSGNGPWVTDYEAMALKTAIRRLFRWLPKSSEMAQAAAVDAAPERGDSQALVWDSTVSDALAEHSATEDAVTTDGQENAPEDAISEPPMRQMGDD